MANWINHVVVASANPPISGGAGSLIEINTDGTINASGTILPSTVVAGSTYISTPGNFVVALVYCWANLKETSLVSNTGYTLQSTSTGGTGTAVYLLTKISGSGSSSDAIEAFAGTGNNYAVIAEFFEFPANSTFVTQATSHGVSSGGAGPSISGLSGLNHIFSASGQTFTPTSGTASTSWNQGTVLVDSTIATVNVTIPAAATDYGYTFSSAYLPDSSASSSSSTSTVTGNSNTQDRLTFAINIVPGATVAVSTTANITASGTIAASTVSSVNAVASISPIGSVAYTKSASSSVSANITAIGGVKRTGVANVQISANVSSSLSNTGLANIITRATITASGRITGQGVSLSALATIRASGVIGGVQAGITTSISGTIASAGRVGKKSGATGPNTHVAISASGRIGGKKSISVPVRATIVASGRTKLVGHAIVTVNARLYVTRIVHSQAVGSLLFSGAAVGKKKQKAAGTGSFLFHSAASGFKPSESFSTGSFSWTGATVSHKTPKASSTSAFNFKSSASGEQTPISSVRIAVSFISEDRAYHDLTLKAVLEDRATYAIDVEFVSQDRQLVTSTTEMISEDRKNFGISYEFVSADLPSPVLRTVSSTSTGARTFVTATSREIGQSQKA